MSITAMKQALEALKYIGYVPREDGSHPIEKAITALRTAISEAEACEPVATLHDDGYWTWKGTPPYASSFAGWRMDVYAAPVQAQERKPLEKREIMNALMSVDPGAKRLPPGFEQFARAIEAAHNIKEQS